MRRDDVLSDATVGWQWLPDDRWMVWLESVAFDRVEATADDAFEALCDQGGGRRAYRRALGVVQELVDTFEPVDASSVTTVAEQRAAFERWYEEIAGGQQKG